MNGEANVLISSTLAHLSPNANHRILPHKRTDCHLY